LGPETFVYPEGEVGWLDSMSFQQLCSVVELDLFFEFFFFHSDFFDIFIFSSKVEINWFNSTMFFN